MEQSRVSMHSSDFGLPFAEPAVALPSICMHLSMYFRQFRFAQAGHSAELCARISPIGPAIGLALGAGLDDATTAACVSFAFVARPH